MQKFSDIVDVIGNIFMILGGMLAGIWALYRFKKYRELETALEIDYSINTSQEGNQFSIVSIDIILRNVGKSKISLSQKDFLVTKKPVYIDDDESLKYSCGLQIRRISVSCRKTSVVIDWFGGKNLEPINDIPKGIDLMNPYRISGTNLVDFWCEPGESYHLQCVMSLPAGHYLAKVTVIGENCKTDFWTRLFYFSV